MKLPTPRTVLALFLLALLLQMLFATWQGAIHFWGLIAMGQLLALLLPMSLCVWRGRYDRRRLFPLPRPRVRHLLWIAGIAICVALTTEWAVHAMQHVWHTPPLFEEIYAQWLRMDSPGRAAMVLLLFAVLPAVVEESFFRGFAQTALVAHHGTLIGWATTSLLFAAAHSSTIYFPLYFLLGGYLGYLRLRGGTLWWPIAAHFVNNAWTLVHQNGFVPW